MWKSLASTAVQKTKPQRQERQPSIHYVDASGQIAGRLCSNVAKLLLNGNRVVVVNARNTLISGQRQSVMNSWLEYLKIASVVHPKHGPFHSRTPDGIITRMVRGMVPRRKPKGEAAMRRLRVYAHIPEEYSKEKFETFENAKVTKPPAYYVSLAQIANRIGWKGENK
jgi:large subunit ribosomal protein L13